MMSDLLDHDFSQEVCQEDVIITGQNQYYPSKSLI